jgi:hypothetical protein
MKAFLLLVTWLAPNQPPSHYQVQFSSNETCEAARQQLIRDAERIGQAMIERATAQDRQLGSGNKTSLVMAAIRLPGKQHIRSNKRQRQHLPRGRGTCRMRRLSFDV